jgi:hypothetical protein
VTLPAPGTPARDELHRQALDLALRVLDDQPHRLAEALYLVYNAFRLRFLEERDLFDVVPGRDAASVEALQDARTLQVYVAECWGQALLSAFK